MSPVEKSDDLEPARLFAAMGDPTRLQLIARMADGSRHSIAQMGKGLPISRQAVSKHLEVLHQVGLVHRSRSGREVHFALKKQAIEKARAWLNRVEAPWDSTLARLKAFAEDVP